MSKPIQILRTILNPTSNIQLTATLDENRAVRFQLVIPASLITDDETQAALGVPFFVSEAVASLLLEMSRRAP